VGIESDQSNNDEKQRGGGEKEGLGEARELKSLSHMGRKKSFNSHTEAEKEKTAT